MNFRMVVALTLLIGSAIAPVFATPTQQGASIVGDTNGQSRQLGDPGALSFNPHWTAHQLARADRQAPGTENGNQPDRAQAGGGGR